MAPASCGGYINVLEQMKVVDYCLDIEKINSKRLQDILLRFDNRTQSLKLTTTCYKTTFHTKVSIVLVESKNSLFTY